MLKMAVLAGIEAKLMDQSVRRLFHHRFEKWLQLHGVRRLMQNAIAVGEAEI